MNRPVISVIIPVYNQEKYVGKCIRSVLGQSFQDFEVIIVNDGSTDKSLKICQKYAKNDHRITVIDKQNDGVTLARKDGVLKSQGDYLFFIDSDDYLVKNALGTLIEIAKKHDLDMVVGNHDIVFDNWGLVSKQSVPFNVADRIIDKEELLGMFLRMGMSNNHSAGVYMWGVLYRSSCIFEALDNNEPFLFPPHEILSEDKAFNLSLVQYLKSSYMINDTLYHYRFGGFTSKYFPNFFRTGYYFNYRFELCEQKGLHQYFPIILLDYCSKAFNDVCSRLHYKISTVPEIERLLLQEFEVSKIAKWARSHAAEIPDKIKNDPMVQFLLNGNSDALLCKLDERERFLRKHHYWKMRIMSFYQKVVDII